MSSVINGTQYDPGDWNGKNAQDTGIFYKANLIGVVQDIAAFSTIL